MRSRIFVITAITSLMLVGCRQTPEYMGAPVDNDSNVLTGGPITGVTLQDLPPAVKATLKQQVPHAEIELIETKPRNGQLVYQFTFADSSNTPKLCVSKDGKVLPASTKDEK